MSKTNEYIDEMIEDGVDILAANAPVDADFQYEKYLESLKEMNKVFEPETKSE